jgi:Flp pilus assembly protein TadG
LLKLHNRGRREGGQTLILVTLALPLFLALMSLVIDGGNILVHKRNIQVAADAAALAAARDLASRGAGPCDATCLASVQSSAEDYSHRNGATNNLPQCTSTVTTNCFDTPFQGNVDQVEVRLTQHVTTFLAGMIGIYSANVSARAVASGSAIFGTTTVPGTVIHGTTFVTTVNGETHTTTDPDQLSGGSGVAFTMSRVCNAIQYTGAGTKGDDVLGAFATNGGLNFGGLGNGSAKKVTWLAFDQARCGPVGDPASPPSGTSQCTAKAWGDPANSSNACVKTLAPLHNPVTWPITPPTLPTPLPSGVAFNPATDYPSKCADPGTQIGQNWASTHPPGIYCVSGAGTTLQFSSSVDLTNNGTGPGYTFFALNGATISTSGNSLRVQFYYPATGCNDPRPTIGRPTSYVCFGRTITNYDPETLFYSTFASADGTCAICLQGQSGNITGDIFATKPDVAFPPSLTQTGGLINVGGGALAAGRGFIESWNLKVAGNTGSYQGTGASIVIPGQTHTTTDPSTVSTLVTPDTTTPSTVEVTTVGTGIQLKQ